MNSSSRTLSPGLMLRVPLMVRPLLHALTRLAYGQLTLMTPEGESHVFQGKEPGFQAHLHIKDWRALSRMALAGDIGLAEAWRDGWVESQDWALLMQLALQNEDALDKAIHGSWLGKIGYWLKHLSRANTRKGSRRNIHAHYDLGNDFYRLWLDGTMTYSSAIFSGEEGQSLASAQEAKYERILQRLDAKPGQHILEIGCGWGGFAEYAIRSRGVRVTGVTLSTEQLDFAQQRLAAAGLAEHADLRLQDYRDISGQFDHIVSIEMLEAVGERWWPSYFDTLYDRLLPGGRAVVQVITIGDAYFERYKRGTDFIQQFIFPGGMLPSPGVLEQQITRAGLVLTDNFTFGHDYAKTLRYWLHDFNAVLPQVQTQGFDLAFVRIWQFYFHYCIAGFEAGRTDVCQLEIHRR